MPADRVNNFLLQLCLNRVEVGVVHGHKLHVIWVPNAYSAIVWARSDQIFVWFTVSYAKDRLKMACFSLEFSCLSLQVVDGQCSIFQRNKNSSALIRFIVEENHRVGAFTSDLIRLTRFITSYIPALNCADFIIWGDEVTRTVRHPHYVVNHVLLWLKAFHDSRLLREALEAD